MKNGIIAAGNWIVDKVKTTDRWPEEGELCNIISETFGGGGGPCNVLFDLAAMTTNIDLYAVGLVGSDSEGKWLKNEIKQRNIDSSFMKETTEVRTSYTDVINCKGQRTFFHSRGANSEFAIDHLKEINIPAKIFYLGYLLLLDKLDSADNKYGTQGARALKMMKDRGYQTVVDLVSEDGSRFKKTVQPSLPYIDCLVINEIEAGHCISRAIRQPDKTVDWNLLLEAPKHLFSQGVNELVVIHLPEGALAMKKDGETVYEPSCDIARKNIVGSTGAGDAFCAGVLYSLHENLPILEMLKISNASSYFNLLSKTASEGAVPPEKLYDHLEKCEFSKIPDLFSKI